MPWLRRFRAAAHMRAPFRPYAGRKSKPKRRKKAAPAPAPTGGADAIGDFLTSREGTAIQRKVMRGVFGMLKKRL